MFYFINCVGLPFMTAEAARRSAGFSSSSPPPCCCSFAIFGTLVVFFGRSIVPLFHEKIFSVARVSVTCGSLVTNFRVSRLRKNTENKVSPHLFFSLVNLKTMQF